MEQLDESSSELEAPPPLGERLERVDSVPESTMPESTQRCSRCNNTFMHDSNFCRKCGNRRPREDTRMWLSENAIWSWSESFDGRNWTWTGRGKEAAPRFRFLDRSGPFDQSCGRWNVQHIAPRSDRRHELRRLYFKDFYHTFIDGAAWVQLLIYFAVYVVVFSVFAGLFLLISDKCNLGLEGSFVRAYYLSVETVVTIGYGVNDQFFNDCVEGTFVLTVVSLLQYFLNAVVIGSVFMRLTRPQARSNTIIFSNKAIIQRYRGAFFFTFQVCEAKHHDLLEAHVRCYCIRHDRKPRRTCEVFPMRLQVPDDTMGGMLLLTLPTQIVHRIDNWSPLSPAWDDRQRKRLPQLPQGLSRASSSTSVEAQPAAAATAQLSSWAPSWPDAPKRQSDAEQGERDACVCPTCGETFQTVGQLRLHAEYQAAQDAQSGAPPELCHRRWSPEDFESWGWSMPGEGAQQGRVGCPDAPTGPERQELVDFLTGRYVEVLVFIEGIEPTTSCTLQARHSYVFPDDVVWDMDFADCCLMGSSAHPCAVDLSLFHELVPSYAGFRDQNSMTVNSARTSFSRP